MSTTTSPPAEKRSVRARPRRLAVAAAVLALVALVAAGCKQLDENNRAASIFGAQNGQLPAGWLVQVRPGCSVYWEAAVSMKTMIADAQKAGVTITATSCYRDYAGQVAARQSWCDRGSCDMAAVPGTSNHGWGKAVDFGAGSGSMTFDSAAYQWMVANAGMYGWLHPKSMNADGPIPEPWHWEWVGDGGKMFPGEYFGIGNELPLKGSPIGSVDLATPTTGRARLQGWSMDPDQQDPINVHLYVDGGWGGSYVANVARPDVAAAYPAYASRPHGYDLSVAVSPGQHTFCVYGIEASGTGSNTLLGCRTVTVPAAVASALDAEPPAPSTTSTTATPAPAGPSTTTSAVPASSTTTSAPATATTVPAA